MPALVEPTLTLAQTSSVDAIAKAAQDSAAAAAIASGKNRYEQLCQASQTAYNDRNPHMKKEG